MTLVGRLAVRGKRPASIPTTGATEDLHHALRVTLLVGLVVVAQLWGCGKRGPPLAPFVRVAARVTELSVRRLGDEVYVGFTLPPRNQDDTQPADLARVDVYAMTTQPRVPPDRTLGLEEFETAATLVRSIEVSGRQTPADAPAAGLAGEAPLDPRPAQGAPVAISETLVPATLVPVDPWADEREEETDDDETPVIVPLMTPTLPGPLQREYVVVSVSSKGRETEARRIAVPLVMPPAPPPAPVVTYTAEVIDITWELPPGARATVQAPATSTGGSATRAPASPASSGATPTDVTSNPAAGQTATGTPSTTPVGAADRIFFPFGFGPFFGFWTAFDAGSQTPPVLASRPIVEWPPASRYDLYEMVESEGGPLTMPQPLNTTALTTPAYADRRVEFGLERVRCYAVRTLDVVGGLDVRSRLSAETCVVLVDTFPPAAPEGLRAVGSDGAVGLIWQPNDEEDLAGYLVLRGVSPGETLQPLTPEPVPEPAYRDTTAEPGVRYVYAVRAVDTVTPPNVSPLSNQVEGAAR